MATNNFHTTAGLVPDDNGADSGTNLFYITAGLPPDDLATSGVFQNTDEAMAGGLTQMGGGLQ